MSNFTPQWRKSSRSAGNPSNSCVELAVMADGSPAISDSKYAALPGGRPTLEGMTATDLGALLGFVRSSR